MVADDQTHGSDQADAEGSVGLMAGYNLVRQGSDFDEREEIEGKLDVLYARPFPGRAGGAKISLGEDLMIGFDVERSEVVDVVVGGNADAQDLAVLLGSRAAKQIANRQESAFVPLQLPSSGILAAAVAVIDRLLAIPLRREAKRALTTELVSHAILLAETDFDVEDFLTYHLAKLPRLYEFNCHEVLGSVGDDQHLVAAIAAGAEYLDPLEDEWEWFTQMMDDLPDDTLKLVQHLEDSSTMDSHRASTHHRDGRHRRATPFRVGTRRSVSGRAHGDRVSSDAKRSGSRLLTRGVGRAARRSWAFPLYWRLIDGELLPDDEGFDDAVRLSRDQSGSSTGMIRVHCPSQMGKRPALHARITANGEIVSVGALLSDDRGWTGSMPLPSDFNSDQYHVEVTSSVASKVIGDYKAEERMQWALLAQALDLAGFHHDSQYSWQKADDLTTD